jgi:hypothetical protein
VGQLQIDRIAVGDFIGEHVPHRPQQLAGNGSDRLLASLGQLEAPKLRLPVRVRPGRRMRGEGWDLETCRFVQTLPGLCLCVAGR